MKTSIIIKGSIMSQSQIKRFLTAPDKMLKHLNSSEYVYNSKKEAVKALSAAYHSLKEDKEDWAKSNASYRYGSYLSYDAATAHIYKP